MKRVWVTSPSYNAAVGVLIEARSNAGLTQRQLAERLDKPRSFVSKVESKERRLDIVELIPYARALDVQPAELIEKISQAISGPVVF